LFIEDPAFDGIPNEGVARVNKGKLTAT